MLEVDIKAQRGGFALEVAFVAKAGVTALIGSTGAGKSSVLRLVAGLDMPAMGSIRFNGATWFDEDKPVRVVAKSRRIGMVFQRPQLLEHLSVVENIQLGRNGVEPSAELLVQTGCDALLAKSVAGLSGGEQQRVMLARALAGEPALLLLDEPLSALDVGAKDQLLLLLGSVLPGLNIPVLYVTHALDEIARLASQIVHMRDGRVVARGAPTEVLAGLNTDTVPDDSLRALSIQGHSVHETATSSVLVGEVTSIEAGGIARVHLGEANKGQFVEIASGAVLPGQMVHLRLWARDLILALDRPTSISARNCLSGQIEALTNLPSGQVLVRVSIARAPVSVLIMARTAEEMGLQVGQDIFVVFKSASLELVSPNAGTKLN